MTHYADLHAFADPALLEQALTHPSYANEHPGAPTYQRLEFLGDAVLQLVVSELLLERFPEWDEGQLSKARAQLVDRRRCAALAVELGLHDALRTERGLAGGLQPGSKALADAFEALVAAVYADAGLVRAREVVAPLLASALATLTPGSLRDAKSALQELCQGRKLPLPDYRDRGHTGPDHAREYAVEVCVDGRPLGRGVGRSKRLAQDAAAREALAALAANGDESAT